MPAASHGTSAQLTICRDLAIVIFLRLRRSQKGPPIHRRAEPSSGPSEHLPDIGASRAEVARFQVSGPVAGLDDTPCSSARMTADCAVVMSGPLRLGRGDGLALASLIGTALVIALPILRGGYLTYIDNPVHLAEIYDLARPGNGWSEIGF